MFAVAIQSGAAFVAARPKVLFDIPAMPTLGGGARPYDIASDGRFVMIRGGESDPAVESAPHLIVVQNWFGELERLVPIN